MRRVLTLNMSPFQPCENGSEAGAGAGEACEEHQGFDFSHALSCQFRFSAVSPLKRPHDAAACAAISADHEAAVIVLGQTFGIERDG